MKDVELVTMRLENVPVSELSIQNDARAAPCGYRVAFELRSTQYPRNAALTLELQLRNPPAIEVKHLSGWLLGYLEGLLRNSLEDGVPHRIGFDQGFAAATPKLAGEKAD
jgi:hypothetical protein